MFISLHEKPQFSGCLIHWSSLKSFSEVIDENDEDMLPSFILLDLKYSGTTEIKIS
jgi:hypothetical protein